MLNVQMVRKVKFGLLALALVMALTLGILLSHEAKAAELPSQDAVAAQVLDASDVGSETISFPAQDGIDYNVTDGSYVSSDQDGSSNFIQEVQPEEEAQE